MSDDVLAAAWCAECGREYLVIVSPRFDFYWWLRFHRLHAGDCRPGAPPPAWRTA